MGAKKMLYEISARSWIRRYGETATLADIPQDAWTRIADQGFHYVWLMGVWQTSIDSIEAFCFHPDLTKRYSEANSGWKHSDVWGSPYAIDDYVLHRALGSMKDLEKTHKAIKQAGMELILDFVPNHFNAYSSIISENPNCFVQGTEEQLYHDQSTYYRHDGYIFAHGKDPYFPAWTDTIQVNYNSESAHNLMLSKLEHIRNYCDGVRCDMAMLVLPDIFNNTWASTATEANLHFWQKAIPAIKKLGAFTFIAESYWDREEELQNIGFDYTYDKNLLDLLLRNDHGGMEWHFGRDRRWHEKSVKFIENHDEDRSLHTLGFERSRAAAVISATLPGMMLVFDGQIEGYRHRVPVQLALDSYELGCPCSITADIANGCSCQTKFYDGLLSALKHPAFQGHHTPGTSHASGVYVWQWSNEQEQLAVFVNYSSELQQVKFPQLLVEKDILNDVEKPTYLQSHADHAEVSLPPYKAAIFELRS